MLRFSMPFIPLTTTHHRFFRNCINKSKTHVTFSANVTTINVMQNTSVQIKNPIVVDYLVTKYGIPRDNAITASNSVSASASPSSLQNVTDFLKKNGFDEGQIRSIVMKYPKYLGYNVEKTLEPKFKVFKELGFKGEEFADLISKSPNTLSLSIDNYLIPHVEFLRSVLHTNENIVKVLKKSIRLLTNPYNIRCNIEFLRGFEVSEKQLTSILMKNPQFMIQDPEWFKGVVARVDEYGVNHDSGLFIHAVYVIGGMSEATVEAKFDIYKSYGWCESDIVSAFRKFPYFLHYSDQNISAKMSFFINEVGYEAKDIALRPIVLGFSLNKALKPRNEVLNKLVSMGLLDKKPDFLSAAAMSKEKFLKKYVIKYADKAHDLHLAYLCSQS